MRDPLPSTETTDVESELVAYLDGELDHAGAQRVERRLSEDPEFRRRLQQLQRAWDLLDQLPRVEAPENFATTTIEMVAIKATAESDDSVGRLRRGQFVRRSLQAIGLVATIVFGYMVVQTRQQAPERQFLRDLPVVENVDLYLSADDIDFVRQLQRENLFDQEITTPPATTTNTNATAESLEERRAWVAKMPEDGLEEIRRKREVFEEVSAEKQQRLRDLHREIEEDAKSAELRETLQRYSAWLRTLPAGRRAELLSLSADERLTQVRQLLEQQRREQEQRMPRPPSGRSLKGDDMAALTTWIDDLLVRHEDEIMNLIPVGFFRDRLRQTTEPHRRRPILLFTLSRRLAEGGSPLGFPTEADYQALAKELSPAARQELETLPTPKEQGELVFEWARTQYFTQFQPQQPSREELEKYFREEMSANDRAWLEGMPPERFARELRRHFQAQAMRRAFDPQRSSTGKPMGPGGPGGPGRPPKPASDPSQ